MSLQFGIQPFWFWNGDMNGDTMRHQIGEMHDKGVRGFFIHPRQGLTLPYLAKPFFDKAALAVEEAKKRGMEVWLYDEYPYPSGIAGGLVTLEHPEYACQNLSKTCMTVGGGESVEHRLPWGRIVSAVAYPLENGVCSFEKGVSVAEWIGVSRTDEIFQRGGLTSFNQKRYFTANSCRLFSWRAPAVGDYKVYIYLEVEKKDFKYFGNFIDPLNKNAIDCYIKHTHENYKKHLGHEFGKTIKGFFTDEVTPGTNGNAPWSPLLPDLVRQYGGFDLTSYLPALTEDMGEITAKVRYHYKNAVTEGFIESYEKPLYEWCEENGLYYTGEKPILRSKQLAHVHLPGIDTGHQKAGDRPHLPEAQYRGNGKIASSAAHFYEKPGVLCEAFHSIGWGVTMQDMKWTFDWLAASGVNWFVIHGYFFSTDGLKKHDAPPSPFLPMPWWKHAAQLSAYADYVGGLVRSISPCVRLLLVDPVTTFWTADAKQAETLKKSFARLQEELLFRGVEYYIADPALVAEGRTEEEDGWPVFALRKDHFSAILLPFMANIEPCAIPPLTEFAAAGGSLLTVGFAPSEDIGYGRPDAFSALCRPLSAETAGEYLEALLPPLWKVSERDGKTPAGLLRISGLQTENGCETPALYLMNPSGAEKTAVVSFEDKTAQITLAPFASRFLTPDTLQDEPAADYILSLDGDFAVSTLSPNALRLNNWEMTTLGQTAQAEAVPILNQLAEGGFSLPVSVREPFGCPKTLQFTPVQAVYKTRFYKNSRMDAPVCLVVEPGSLDGKWTMTVNGRPLPEDALAKRFFYHDTNLAAEVTALLRDGENELCLTITAETYYGGLTNPLYLMGDFAVFPHQSGLWSLEPPALRGPFKDLAACGLPFFAGTVQFTKTVANLPETARTLALADSALESCVSLALNGENAGTLAWSPYRFTLPALPQKGENTVALTVETTLLELFEGQYYDKETLSYRPLQPAGQNTSEVK